MSEFDPTAIKVADIGSLIDEEFRELVDADLRRNSPNPGQRTTVADEVSLALREEHFDRWFLTLNRIASSVDGQLAARSDRFMAERAVLRAQICDVDADTQIFNPTATKAKLEADLERAKAAFYRNRSGTMRFKSGLDETLLEARFRAGVSDAVTERLTMLERAIADHKRMIEVDELECTDADRQLWAAAGLALDLV